jgi:hypothetical protein
MFFPLSSVLVYPNSWWATLLVICKQEGRMRSAPNDCNDSTAAQIDARERHHTLQHQPACQEV